MRSKKVATESCTTTLAHSGLGALRVSWNDPYASKRLGATMAPYVFPGMSIVCVGSANVLGDSVGPRVGTMLAKLISCGLKASVVGTMQNPVHANNVHCYLHTEFHLAVDASLGKHIGRLVFKPWPLSPGTGVSKELPLMGNIHLTATTGSCYDDLLTVPLEQVCEMSAIITNAISYALAVHDSKWRMRISGEIDETYEISEVAAGGTAGGAAEGRCTDVRA